MIRFLFITMMLFFSTSSWALSCEQIMLNAGYTKKAFKMYNDSTILILPTEWHADTNFKNKNESMARLRRNIIAPECNVVSLADSLELVGKLDVKALFGMAVVVDKALNAKQVVIGSNFWMYDKQNKLKDTPEIQKLNPASCGLMNHGDLKANLITGACLYGNVIDNQPDGVIDADLIDIKSIRQNSLASEQGVSAALGNMGVIKSKSIKIVGYSQGLVNSEIDNQKAEIVSDTIDVTIKQIDSEDPDLLSRLEIWSEAIDNTGKISTKSAQCCMQATYGKCYFGGPVNEDIYGEISVPVNNVCSSKNKSP